MIFHKVTNILFGSLVIVAFYGCAGNLQCQKETQLDSNWGRSYETAKYNQIQDLEAAENVSPVTGLDGRVGERVVESYVKEGTCKKESSRREIGILGIKE